MIRKLTDFLNYGLFAELALSIFAIVFVAIVIRTLLMRKEDTEAQASIVLHDSKLPTEN